jgi:RimJ/RimL family protein N-acetyltransferase
MELDQSLFADSLYIRERNKLKKWPQSYKYFPDLERSIDGLLIRPIRRTDSEEIRNWRNNQMKVLRQKELLTQREQGLYFDEVVKGSLTAKRPDQILLGIEDQNNLVAYGGLVHISWEDRRAELSFLTNGLLNDELYERYFAMFINYVVSIAKNDFGLHKIFTETYAFRRHHISILEKNGLKTEGKLADHIRMADGFYDSILHGVILD